MERESEKKVLKQKPLKKAKYEPPRIESEILPVASGDDPEGPINPISALIPFFNICCP